MVKRPFGMGLGPLPSLRIPLPMGMRGNRRRERKPSGRARSVNGGERAWPMCECRMGAARGACTILKAPRVEEQSARVPIPSSVCVHRPLPESPSCP